MMSRRRSVVAALAFILTVLPSIAVLSNVSTASAAHPTRRAVVAQAVKYLHYRYTLTGDSPRTGFSCIGFVYYVFQSLGIDMPGSLTSAMASYPRIPERDLLPGDIVFFQNTLWRGVSHVAIYIGGGRVIHAENPSRGVNISAIRDDPQEGNYWQEHYLVAERPLGGAHAFRLTAHHPTSSVDVSSLNFRSGHSLYAVVVKVLLEGTPLTILGKWQEWYYVRLESGLTGWVVQAGVLQPSGQAPGDSHPPREILYSVVAGVNIHSGPALADSVISVTVAGMKASILARENGFIKINATSGVTGWIMSRFVEWNQSKRPNHSHGHHYVSGPKHRTRPKYRIGMLTITAHLRTGPSLYDPIIEWVEAGTRVRILGSVPLWDRVRVNKTLSGYIYAPFVKS